MRTIVYLSQEDMEKLLSGRKIEFEISENIRRSDVMELRMDMSHCVRRNENE